VRGLESEKGKGKGMGVVTEERESGIHGRYIVELFLLGIWPGCGQSKIRDGGDQSGRWEPGGWR